MKRSFMKHISLLGLLLFLFSACEKDEERMIAKEEGTSATLTASSQNLVLQKANAQNQAISFTWNKADFGYNAALVNTLQIAAAGTNFANAKEVALSDGTSSTNYTVLEFNALLLSMDLPTGVNSNVEVRLKSEVANTDDIAPVYSNAITLSVNPYPLISFVYVPGGYQGWNPTSADSLISATSNGIYTGVINFPGVGDNPLEFKITPAKNWTTAYGSAGDGKVSTSGSNFSVPEIGMYRLTLNLNDNTFAAQKYSWGVIGNATPGGWDADTDMMYNNGTQTWSVTLPLVPGNIKFRLNNEWGTNYGGSGGTLTQGGADIPVTTAGTYRITFNLTNNTYTLVRQ